MTKPFLFFICCFSFSLAAFGATPEGAWEKSCEPVGDEDFIVSTLEITPETWTRERRAFEDSNCATPWISFREVYLQDENDSSSLRMQQAFYLPLTREVADGLNLVAYCGIENWQASTWTEVTGRSCQDFQIPAQGQSVDFVIQFHGGDRPEDDRLIIEKGEAPYHRRL